MALLDINKISLVRGMAYNPHSQGIVEREHRTIKNALICQYLEKKDEFDLQESLNVVVNRYTLFSIVVRHTIFENFFD